MAILTQLFSFKGRASRTEFWLVQMLAGALFIAVVFAAIAAVGGSLQDASPEEVMGALAGVGLLVIGPAFIALMWAGYAAAARRLHDRGKSAQWLFFFLAPTAIFWLTALTSGFAEAFAVATSGPMVLLSLVTGPWYFIELGCLSGTDGPNRYDAAPGARAKVEDDFHGSWADKPIEELAGHSAAAAPKPRKPAAANAAKPQGFGRRSLQA